MVVVLLRGAYDGLSAFAPFADADYYALRPYIAIAAPDGTGKTSIKLDNTFALHPSLSMLLHLWQRGVLSFVPKAGLPAPNRSHFNAHFQMEIDRSNKTSDVSHWRREGQPGNFCRRCAGQAHPARLGRRAHRCAGQ